MKHATIAEALAAPRSTHFRVTHRGGTYAAGDDLSFFGRRLPDPEISFDTSNNKVLVNVAQSGGIRLLSIYRGQHGVDDIPGVWVRKEFSRAGPFGFTVQIDGETVDLAAPELPYTTSLLANIFPVTDYEHPRFRATTLTFAPISHDGERRLRCAVHGLQLTNGGENVLQGRIGLPLPRRSADAPFADPEICVHLAEGPHCDAVAFSLRPGQSIWVPAVLYPFGETTVGEVNEKGALGWLDETWSYMKRMTGALVMDDDPFAAEFLERAVHQCFGSVGMDASGNLVGSNWGTFPTTEKVWTRDYFYSLLPFQLLEPAFLCKGIEWFAEHGTRPMGNNYVGGPGHSLTNALSATVLAGLYYRATGDKTWFMERPDLDRKLRSTLDAAIAMRREGAVLFPSLFLSDGYSLGDVHTGSNVFAWVALHHYAGVVLEVFGDAAEAKRYAGIADALKQALEMSNIVPGPFGPQYLEGISENPVGCTREPASKYDGAYRDFGMRYIGPLLHDGYIDLMHHDGEESDTILMPHYGYSRYDAVRYRNYMRFSLSEHNPVYNPESRGMQWGDRAAATFPGYMNGLGLVTDAASLSGPQGYLTEIRKLTDVDGSLWWWPYHDGAAYGDVVRHHNCGKCGWASGVFASMFVTEVLGLSFDGPRRVLRFRPFSPSSGFRWSDFTLGAGRFSVEFRREDDLIAAAISNHGADDVTVEWTLPCAGTASLNADGVAVPQVRRDRWNGLEVACFATPLASGKEIRISAIG